MTVKYFNWLNNMNLITSTQFFVSGLSYCWVHMYWINCLTLWMLIKNTTYSSEHVVHRLS